MLVLSPPLIELILATGFRQLRKVIAMTGTGSSDGIFLKRVGVGFALGIVGTEVAK